MCRIGGKAVQLHHLDGDRSNADPDNFAVLCVDCHNDTQLRGGFGRHLNEAQVRRYRDEWNRAVADRLHEASRQSSEGHMVIGAPAVRADDVIDRILSEADRSPKVGLRLMDAELEQESRRLLAGSGWAQGRHDWKLRAAIDRLFELGVVSASVHTSLDVLEKTREALDAGHSVGRDEVLRALDVGIFTYRALAAVPRERHYVVDAKIPVFLDPEGRHVVEGVSGVRIRSVGPRPRSPRDAVFLTRGVEYVVGSEVTWLWGSEVLGPAWYLDVESGTYMTASSVEFRGVALDNVA